MLTLSVTRDSRNSVLFCVDSMAGLMRDIVGDLAAGHAICTQTTAGHAACRCAAAGHHH